MKQNSQLEHGTTLSNFLAANAGRYSIHNVLYGDAPPEWGALLTSVVGEMVSKYYSVNRTGSS